MTWKIMGQESPNCPGSITIRLTSLATRCNLTSGLAASCRIYGSKEA